MKKVILSLLLITAFCYTGFSQAVKIGHVDSNAIFELMPEKQTSKQTLEEYAKTLEDQLTTLYKQYEDLETDYRAYIEKENASTAVRQMKEQDLLNSQKKIQMFQQTAQKDLQDKEAAVLEPIYTKIKDAIKEVGKEMHLTYVLDASSLLYAAPESVDISENVKAKLNLK